jgi:hypothetical protein
MRKNCRERTVRSSTERKQIHSQGAVQRQFELEFRSLVSLAIWLDQEEELVQLVQLVPEADSRNYQS